MDTVLLKQPETVRWSRDVYSRMSKLGWFEGKRVELIEGEIYEIPPASAAHAAVAKVTFQSLCAVVPKGYHVGFQNPLNLGMCSEPRPDVSVLLGSPQDYVNTVPPRVAMVAEVADSSLEFDRGLKARLYASAGVYEYWILDLVGQKLTVKRNPSCNALGAGKAGYLDVSVHGHNSTISALMSSGKPILVSSLLRVTV